MENYDLDALIPQWLTFPDAADALGVEIGGIRRLVADAELVSVKRGNPAVRSIPRALVEPELVPGLPGTVTLLRDCGCSDEELLGWLFTTQDDDVTPLHLLRIGHRTEVRRRAQLLSF